MCAMALYYADAVNNCELVRVIVVKRTGSDRTEQEIKKDL
jgi:hypothetical protein